MDSTPRSPKDKDRFFIDNTFFSGGWAGKLGPYAIAVYNAIAMHANFETQEAWPSHNTIAKLTGMSTRQVIREVEQLESYNIVSVKSRQEERKPAIITLLDKSAWKPVDAEHMTDSHMTDSHMTDSHMTYDSESDEHMTGSHTNRTNKTELNNKKESRSREDYLGDVLNGQGQVSEQSASNPDDQWLESRDKALKAFPGNWGRTVDEQEIKRNLILGFVANTTDFNSDHWAYVIQDSIAHGVSSNNIARFIEVYPFKDYEAYLASKFPREANGRDSPGGNGGKVEIRTAKTTGGGFNL